MTENDGAITPQGRIPASWSWKPVNAFILDLEICGQRIDVEVVPSERQEVAESLMRLAEAVYPTKARVVLELPTCCENGWFHDNHVCMKQDGSASSLQPMKDPYEEAKERG